MIRFGFLFSVLLSTLVLAGYPQSVRAEESALVPMSQDAMASTSGGSEASIQSLVYGNTIGNIGSTGGISGTDVANNSGLTTVIQNTGNQVSIATATVVNVNFH